MRFDSVDTIVRDMMAQMKVGDTEYVRILRAVIRVLENLNWYNIPEFKSDDFLVKENLTIDLPSDVALVTKVGKLIVGGQGRIRLLGRVARLYSKVVETPLTCTCNVEEEESEVVLTTENTCPACTFYNYAAGGSKGELYGYRVREHPNGTYWVNEADNRIELSSGYDVTPGEYLTVEYKPVFSEDKYKLIPREYFMVIFFGVSEFLNFGLDNSTSSQGYQRYKIEYNRLKRSKMPFSLMDIVRALCGGTTPVNL